MQNYYFCSICCSFCLIYKFTNPLINHHYQEYSNSFAQTVQTLVMSELLISLTDNKHLTITLKILHL